MTTPALRRILPFAAAFCLTIASASAQDRDVPPPPDPGIFENTSMSDYEAARVYLGLWRAEWVSPQNSDRRFRFEYELTPFDQQGLMLEMVITQEFEDGERRLLWRGYKGWNKAAGTTYYEGFSPLSRVSSGVMKVVGDELMTYYTAFDGQGQEVELIDVFRPIEGDSFDDVTYLRPLGTDDWRVIGQSTWHRVE